MSNYTPVPKVTAAGLGGAVTVVMLYVLSLFGISIPEYVAAAITTIIAFGAGYMQPDK